MLITAVTTGRLRVNAISFVHISTTPAIPFSPLSRQMSADTAPIAKTENDFIIIVIAFCGTLSKKAKLSRTDKSSFISGIMPVTNRIITSNRRIVAKTEPVSLRIRIATREAMARTQIDKILKTPS